MAGVVFWMPPKHVLLHQTSSQVKKRVSGQICYWSDLAQMPVTNPQPIKKQKIALEHLEEDFPFLKLPLSDLRILQPEQRKHWETLRAPLKVPHQKSPLPSQGPSSDLLSPADKSQWPSWPQALALWLVMPWVTQTWQLQLCFLRPCMAFSCRSGAQGSWPMCSGWSSSDPAALGHTRHPAGWPCCHQGHSSAVLVHGQVTVWGPNTYKGLFLCSTQQELTHG